MLLIVIIGIVALLAGSALGFRLAEVVLIKELRMYLRPRLAQRARILLDAWVRKTYWGEK